VQMNTCDATALPTFAYGHVEGLGPSANQVEDGTLATGGSYTADGTIRIAVDPSLFGTSSPDLILQGVAGETRTLLGAQCSGLIEQIDSTNPADYTMRGNDYCEPQTVTCPPSDTHPNGYSVPVTFLVNNPSTAPRSFTVQLTDANGWLAGGPVSTTVGPVSPGQSGAVNAIVRMDPDCNPQSDLLQFSATAPDLPAPNEQGCATTLTCEVNTTAVPQPGSAPTYRLDMLGANPCHGSTSLTYAVPRASPVRIEVFSVMGQRVRTLVNRTVEPGEYTARFELRQEGGPRLGPGIYLVRMTAGEWSKGVRVVALN